MAEMIKGKTSKGFSYTVSRKQLNNAEFLELFAKVQNGENLKAFELCEIVLGKEQKKALYDFIRDEYGVVPVDVLAAEMEDIYTALGQSDETKN